MTKNYCAILLKKYYDFCANCLFIRQIIQTKYIIFVQYQQNAIIELAKANKKDFKAYHFTYIANYDILKSRKDKPIISVLIKCLIIHYKNIVFFDN